MNKHETHSTCNKRLKQKGGKAECCWCVPHSHCEFMNKNACCEMCEGNHRNYSGVARVDCKCHSTPAPVKEECNHPEIVAQTVKIVE